MAAAKNKQTDNLVALKPKTQTRLGQFTAGFIIMFFVYQFLEHGGELKGLLAKFIFNFLFPMLYVLALTGKKLKLAKVSYSVWLTFMILFGLVYLVTLLERFSLFLTDCIPWSLAAIFLGVGIRGLARILRPEEEVKDIDCISGITMYAFMVLGFYCGAKIVYGLIHHWNWDLSPQLLFLSLMGGGAVVAFFAAAPAGAFVGALAESFVYHLPKEEKTADDGPR